MEEMDLLKNFMSETSTRISYLDRWIVFDDKFWFIYEQKRRQKVRLVDQVESFGWALNLLKDQ